jgi:hypothetical protein
MKDVYKYLLGAVIGAIVAVAVVGLIGGHNVAPLGAQVQNDQFIFSSGIKVGGQSQFSIDASGNITTSGTLSTTGTGSTQINNFIENGTVANISTTSATYTLTAAQMCQNTLINFTPLGAATTVTLPATSTAFFASCLPQIGSVDYLNYISLATSTVIAAGSGGTLNVSSSTTVVANKSVSLRITRDTASTYRVLMTNYPN